MRPQLEMTALVVAAAVALASTAPAATTSYTITDLGTLSGTMSGAWDITADGTVIGQSTVVDTERLRGFAWNAGLTELPPTGGRPQCVAFAANDTGSIVGASYELGEPTLQATLWDAGGTPTVLGDFVPRGVNDAGVVIGSMTNMSAAGLAVTHAVRWESGSLLDLNTLGGTFSAAHAINNSGWIVGASTTTSKIAVPQAFVWIGGTMHNLGTLGGSWGEALAINDAGAVAGVSDTSAGVPHAFVYQLDAAGSSVTSRTDLGVLAGDTSHAYDINNLGVVVGTSDWRAFVWQSGQMTDLNTCISDAGWELTHATAINDAGQIVGRGRHAGQWRAFLLTPNDCPGDVDGNGVVDLTDLGTLLAHYGTTSGAAREDGDLNGDGAIDLTDLGILLSHYGTSCP